MRTALIVFVCMLLPACATDMEPLYRTEAEVPAETLLAAANSDESQDTASLVLLAELGLHYAQHAPSPETLATVMEAIGTRAAAGTLPATQLEVAGAVAEEFALDDLQDAVVRMNACDLLGDLGKWDALERVSAEAIDPLVGEQAESVLARSGRTARP